MEDGLEPFIHGPYKTENDRSIAALNLHEEMDQDDNIFALDTEIQGVDKIRAWAWTGEFFRED